MNLNKLKHAVIGFAAGDAFGMAYECGKRGEFEFYGDKMVGYTKGMPAYWYGNDIPAGTWTDDTAMIVAELDSVSRLGKIDLDDMMQNFCKWLFEGEFTPYGEELGSGRRTRRALEKFRDGTPARECGGTEESDNSNGALMRILPFAFMDELMEKSGVTVKDIASPTHAHPISVRACEIYVDTVRKLLNGAEKRDILLGFPEPFDRISKIAELKEDEIKSTPYVLDSLEAAVWCFYHTGSYKDCVIKAVLLGGDTDTIAALAGALAAVYYGADSIPQEWLDTLARKDYIEALCEKCAEVM